MIDNDKWNRCASRLLGRPDYNVSRDGYDFLITRFNKFAGSIDNCTIGSILEWCTASVSILNEDTNFREFENRTERFQKYVRISSVGMREIDRNGRKRKGQKTWIRFQTFISDSTVLQERDGTLHRCFERYYISRRRYQ